MAERERGLTNMKRINRGELDLIRAKRLVATPANRLYGWCGEPARNALEAQRVAQGYPCGDCARIIESDSVSDEC